MAPPQPAVRCTCGVKLKSKLPRQASGFYFRDLGLSSWLIAMEHIKDSERGVNCLRKRPDLREWFLPEILCIANKKVEWNWKSMVQQKKNTSRTQHFFRQALHTCCISHWPVSDRCCSKHLLYLLSRRLSSGHPQGKRNGHWHVNANWTLAHMEKTRTAL